MLLRTLKLWILGMECTWRKVTCRYSEEQEKKKSLGWDEYFWLCLQLWHGEKKSVSQILVSLSWIPLSQQYISHSAHCISSENLSSDCFSLNWQQLFPGSCPLEPPPHPTEVLGVLPLLPKTILAFSKGILLPVYKLTNICLKPTCQLCFLGIEIFKDKFTLVTV